MTGGERQAFSEKQIREYKQTDGQADRETETDEIVCERQTVLIQWYTAGWLTGESFSSKPGGLSALFVLRLLLPHSHTVNKQPLSVVYCILYATAFPVMYEHMFAFWTETMKVIIWLNCHYTISLSSEMVTDRDRLPICTCNPVCGKWLHLYSTFPPSIWGSVSYPRTKCAQEEMGDWKTNCDQCMTKSPKEFHPYWMILHLTIRGKYRK